MSALSFEWLGFDLTGKTLHGIIHAENISDAKRLLQERHLVVRLIKQQSDSSTWSHTLRQLLTKRITQHDITRLSRQMLTLTTANVPLLELLEILINSEANAKLKLLLGKIKQELMSGRSLAEAFKQYPLYFNTLFCGLIDVGEQSGTLNLMLNELTLYRETIDSLKKTVKKALSYPCIVLIMSIAITLGLLVFIIPQFESLFTSFNAQLPTMTRLIIKLSTLIQTYWHWLLLCILLSLYGLYHAKNQFKLFDTVILHVPILGNIIKNALMVRFASTLAIALKSGFSLLDALTLVENVLDNTRFIQATQLIKQCVSDGETMSFAIKKANVFSSISLQMIMIGEESGTLSTVLKQVAYHHQNDIEQLIQQLNNVLEPMIMSVLGLLLGGLIVAMYLPIYQLGLLI